MLVSLTPLLGVAVAEVWVEVAVSILLAVEAVPVEDVTLELELRVVVGKFVLLKAYTLSRSGPPQI